MKPSNWEKARLKDVIQFNPIEKIQKGSIGKKIGMDKLQPFQRKVEGFERAMFTGGARFRNGDTLMARITPCLENGKTAQVNILDNDEIGFGSTEFVVMREKKGYSVSDFIYYLAISPRLRDIAIKSMTGTSGRQRAQINVIKNTMMEIPPIEEQKIIAYILSCFDDKINVITKINHHLDLINRVKRAIIKVIRIFILLYLGKSPFRSNCPGNIQALVC
ncbi:MAG: restriction endonuclease subunit S [Sporolactobacillus sp.]|jgi:type I restriction enzyme S subunit|nr:restriction endonuclease subunit S [Sporolactobacillus sp.]